MSDRPTLAQLKRVLAEEMYWGGIHVPQSPADVSVRTGNIRSLSIAPLLDELIQATETLRLIDEAAFDPEVGEELRDIVCDALHGHPLLPAGEPEEPRDGE